MSAVSRCFLPSYYIPCSEFATPAVLVGCVGLPWAKRHWQFGTLGHRVIACLEVLPVIGVMIVMIERIIAVIVARWQIVSRASIANPDYLFLARRAGRSQEGCCGHISVKIADIAREKLQKRATPGILFDPAIYQRCSSIIGTCTAMSLEFASAYFRLRKESRDISPGHEPFLEKMRLLKGSFEKSSEEMRSRQAAYSSITVDRTLSVDVSRSKIESCITYHDFKIDYCSKEVDIRGDVDLLQQEISVLPHGIYFVRMLMPSDNHKLEARGHSMIYIHEEDVGLFYDNNCGLEKIVARGSDKSNALQERILNVHRQWDIPMVRFYRLTDTA